MNIYKITNTKTGKSYIAVTPMSWDSYYTYRLDDAITWSSPFLNMICNTSKSLLEVTLLETVNNPMQGWLIGIYWIKHYNTFEMGYQSNIGNMKYDEGWVKRPVK